MEKLTNLGAPEMETDEKEAKVEIINGEPVYVVTTVPKSTPPTDELGTLTMDATLRSRKICIFTSPDKPGIILEDLSEERDKDFFEDGCFFTAPDSCKKVAWSDAINVPNGKKTVASIGKEIEYVTVIVSEEKMMEIGQLITKYWEDGLIRVDTGVTRIQNILYSEKGDNRLPEVETTTNNIAIDETKDKYDRFAEIRDKVMAAANTYDEKTEYVTPTETYESKNNICSQPNNVLYQDIPSPFINNDLPAKGIK